MRQKIIDIEKSIDNIGSFSRYGKWTHYNKDGQKSSEGSFNWKTNKEDGEWKYYYNNGSLKKIMTYKDGVCFGEYKFWDEEGNLKQKSDCGEQADTIRRKYYFPNGNIKASGLEVYSNEKKDYQKQGRWTYNFENGETQLIEEYKNGEPFRHWEQYLLDGTQILKDGNGVYKVFENNKMIFQSEYKNGGRDGIATWYYDTGQIEQSALYKFDSSEPFGLRMEIISSFDIKGKKRRKGTLKNGNGTWISYDEDGKVSKITEYENGIKVRSK